MAVLEHKVHAKTSIAADKPYGCFNREILDGYQAMQRFAGTTGNEPIWWLSRARIPHRMSRECRYDGSFTDPRCSGCKHQGSGEKYDAEIRARGA